ncbi:MAG: serine/threonine protein kinase, partial [Gammaproteobacteria bacterium]|nr:serine/threonine protein kinase [Gammaproteobacteria bacterium]
AYLSPERAKGLEADHRSDIYALGIIAYNMFNGGLPYKGEPISLLFQHIEGKATPLHRLDKGVSTGVSLLVQNMMAVDIEKRYQTMKDVRDAIKELL